MNRGQLQYKMRGRMMREMRRAARAKTPTPPRTPSHTSPPLPKSAPRHPETAPHKRLGGPYFAGRPCDESLSRDRKYARTAHTVLAMTVVVAFAAVALGPSAEAFYMVGRVCLIALIPEGFVSLVYQAQYQTALQEQREQQENTKAEIYESWRREQADRVAESAHHQEDMAPSPETLSLIEGLCAGLVNEPVSLTPQQALAIHQSSSQPLTRQSPAEGLTPLQARSSQAYVRTAKAEEDRLDHELRWRRDMKHGKMPEEEVEKERLRARLREHEQQVEARKQETEQNTSTLEQKLEELERRIGRPPPPVQ